MYTELKLTTLKQSKGRNGWFRAATAAFMNLHGSNDQELASGDKSLIAVDISSAKENRAAPIQLYFTPEDARAFAAALLQHATGDTLTAEELADFAKPADPAAQTYTVIGLYGETGEVLTCTQTATGPHEAMAITAKEVVAREGRYGDVELLCAIPGDHSPVCACEDAGKCAAAVDLAPAEGEEA